MWRQTIVFLAASGLVLISPFSALCQEQATYKKTGDEQSGIAVGNNQFASDLYKVLSKEEGNLFFSPFSIRTALAMTYGGARGNTAAQMAQVLSFPTNQKKFHPEMGTFIKELNESGSKKSFQLNIANALWGQTGYKFLSEFLLLTRDNYGAKFSKLDFIHQTEEARQTINNWAERKTRGKIKNLIPKGIISPLTRLVLTNAVYFKGTWEVQFDKENTRDGVFILDSGGSVDAPFMIHEKVKFKYLENARFQALEMPYEGDRLAMTIFLPKENYGLAKFEKSMTAGKLSAWIAAFKETELYVSIPRFKTTLFFRLDNVLKKMGMVDAFSMWLADFTGMAAKRELFIRAVVHKAFVNVNEEGTEAAGSTGVIIDLKAVSTMFIADRPFVFMVRDVETGAILFFGRMVNPVE